MADKADKGDTGDGKPAGALLDEGQIRKLKIAIAVMSAFLVVGVVVLIGRVIHLANRAEPVATGAGAATVGAAGAAVLLSDVRLSLPTGAEVKATTLQGQRLVVQYASSRGGGVIILDLATGRPVSHVRFDAAP